MRIFDEWRLLPQRFAVHEPTATAVIADLHLGYNAARQRQGDAIPVRSVREEMQPLIDAVHAHSIRAVIVAGDLFERGYEAVIADAFLVVLGEMGIRFIGLVPGNHDRGIDRAGDSLPILADGHDIAGWRIVHGDQMVDTNRAVMGHWHPALRWRGRKTPCFLTCGYSLVLPAFSHDAAGVDVANDERWRCWERFAIRGQKIVHEKAR